MPLEIPAPSDRDTIDMPAAGARMFQDQRGAPHLAGRIEDHMVGKPRDLFQLFGLVGRAIGADLAIVELGCQPRFPQAGGAHAIQIFADDRRGAPHAEGFQRRQHLDARLVANLREDLAIGAQPGRIHHEGGRIDAAEIELGEGARVTGFCFHGRQIGKRNAPVIGRGDRAVSCVGRRSATNAAIDAIGRA